MKSRISLFLSVFAVGLFGFGCVRVAPRIVQTPSVPSVVETPQAAETPVLQAIAYVRLNGGSATLIRGVEKKDAVDNAELAAGDRIQVTRGAIFILYPDAGQTRLDNGADVTILADGGARGLVAELRLVSGKVWTRFERVFGKDEQFSVAANGVVATVRGTAFGVSVLGEDVDVQVAEHEVEVAPEITNVTQRPDDVTKVAAGEGARVHAKKTVKRALTEVERRSDGYRFALRRLTPEELRRPTTPRSVFERTPVLTPELERRQFFLRQTILQRLEPGGFAMPTRPVREQEASPGATPSQKFQGPSREASTSTNTAREPQVGFVKAVKVIRSTRDSSLQGESVLLDDLAGGLEIELQQYPDSSAEAFQTRNALMQIRIGDFVGSLAGRPSGMRDDEFSNFRRVSFYLTPQERAQIRDGEDVLVFYISPDVERYHFGKLDLSKLEG